MKKQILLLLIVALFLGCKEQVKTVNMQEAIVKTIAPVSKEMMETGIIYEANIRQYSPEGTFKAFTKDIPQLKTLGVNTIWLMPIFPISQTKRKATGGDFASLIEDEATRKKMLGSYYAVSDFTKINSEFGTIEDFRDLVKTAHNNDIYVILDWVPNHTGWDHTWLKTNPEFYTKNAKGEITDPLNDDGTPVGWADVADLNYENKALRAQMLDDMSYWIEKENIDGFRCDMAGMVPIDFWQEAIPKLRAQKELFMLAEAWEPELLKKGLFDMAYAWDRHHTMNAIARGEKEASAWHVIMHKDKARYETDDMLMNFVTNHDENSWNGTIKERMGKASEAMTALSYLTPGMPLIYSGQEYGLDHRLLFFEKDSFPHIKGNMWKLLEKLGKLKVENKALNGGKNSANYNNLSKYKNAIAFSRTKDDSEIIFVANVTGEDIKISLPVSGSYIDYISGNSVQLMEGNITLQPWAYKILVSN